MLIKNLKLGIIGLFAASMTLPIAAPANALILNNSEESITTSKEESPLIARYKVYPRSRGRVYIIRRRKYPRYRRFRKHRGYRRYPIYRRYPKYRIYRRYRIY